MFQDAAKFTIHIKGDPNFTLEHMYSYIEHEANYVCSLLELEPLYKPKYPSFLFMAKVEFAAKADTFNRRSGSYAHQTGPAKILEDF